MMHSTEYKSDNQTKQDNRVEINNPITCFLFALKSSESKRQYPRRLKMFFDINFDKSLSLEEQANLFIIKTSKTSDTKNGIQWATQYFIRFLEYQKVRVERKEISESTIPNYYKAAKLFCLMNDLILNWEKIGKGVPYEKKAADDRPPTNQEITKLRLGDSFLISTTYQFLGNITGIN